MSQSLPGRRVADDAIYLNEDRMEEPKEYFKLIAAHLKRDCKSSYRSLLDVGCATGDLIGYLAAQNPSLEYHGLDVSLPMIKAARKRLPFAEFRAGSVLNPKAFPPRARDVVICAGTLQVFDDLDKPISNLVKATRVGGVVYVFTPKNDRPLDMITRYRDLAGKTPRLWQQGWNIFSKRSFERSFRDTGRVRSIEWVDFRMPHALRPRADPMRTWTIQTQGSARQLVNGTGLMINLALAKVRLK